MYQSGRLIKYHVNKVFFYISFATKTQLCYGYFGTGHFENHYLSIHKLTRSLLYCLWFSESKEEISHQHIEIRSSLSTSVFRVIFRVFTHRYSETTVQKRLRNHYLTVTYFLNSTSLNKPTISFVLIGVLVHGFIVFAQNGRKWCVSVMFLRCFSYLGERNNWDITEICSLWARTLESAWDYMTSCAVKHVVSCSESILSRYVRL